MKRLICESDILVQNFIPKAERKLRLDYDTVKGYNEKLICASICGYPHGSALENKTAFDLTI